MHDLTPIPDAGYLLVRDADYEDLIEAEATRLKVDEALKHDPRNRALLDEQTRYDRVIFRMLTHLYECPQCGRLMRQEQDGYRVYAPEPPDEG
jgi:hypothetical protein